MSTRKEPIRILRIIARINVGRQAGQVSELTSGLEGDEFTTRLVCGQVEPGEANFLDLRDPTLPVRHLNSLGWSIKGLGDLKTLRQLCRIMRTWRPQIVHTHTAKAGLIGRLEAEFVLGSILNADPIDDLLARAAVVHPPTVAAGE